ncbi:MAG: efflux RND transporter periplasmic adaptor subunit [Pseudomonadota bacterium]
MQKKKIGKKKIIIVSIICVTILALASSIAMNPKEDSYSDTAAQAKDLQTWYSFSGNIAAKDSQAVVSKGILPIKKLYVKEGDKVKKGDVLFLLDDSDIAANIDQAAAGVEISRINYEKMRTTTKDQQLEQVANALSSAQLAYNGAKTNLDRMTSLASTGAISSKELEQAQQGYDTAKLQLESAQSNYNITQRTVLQNIETAKAQLDQSTASYEAAKKQAGDLEVLAEIDGEVSEIYVEENESVVTGTKIMDIVDYDDLEVKVKVDEYDLRAVTVGKDVAVTINQLGKDVGGRISEISRKAETVNEVSFFIASVDLENDPDLRVGLSVEVKTLNKAASGATVIPMKALQFDDNNNPYVYYRDKNGKAATKEVTVGINDGTDVQIIEGLKPGDGVLVPEEDKGGFTRPRDMVTEE